MPFPHCGHFTVTVHPHVRGEHKYLLRFLLGRVGSSPRAWGTFHLWYPKTYRSRFIPMCVGNIIICWKSSLVLPVHPHVRGEHYYVRCGCEVIRGSSPRAWGTSYIPPLQYTDFRFIPTCVGNIKPQRIFNRSYSVHPHVRGEHVFLLSRIWCSLGSSPRAWGTSLVISNREASERFIPTCVGNIYALASEA